MDSVLAEDHRPLIATSAVVASDPREFAAWSARTVPEVAQVTRDVRVIPVPAPSVPIRYTMCYVVRSGTSYLLIDPGWASQEGWEALRNGLDAIGAKLPAIRGIVATHAHVDHVGLAARLQLATGAWFGVGEHEPMPPVAESRVAHAEADQLLLETWGVPPELRTNLNIYRSPEAVDPPVPPVDVVLRDGQVTDDVPLRIIATPGHTPGHACFATEDGTVLFTGDHVLPRISPHASVWVGGAQDPLRSYRASLTLPGVEDDALICPGHEYRFVGIRLRAQELDDDLLKRSSEVRRIVEERSPPDVWSLASQVTWSRGWDGLAGMTRRLALAECASHVEYLQSEGLLTAGIATRPPRGVDEKTREQIP